MMQADEADFEIEITDSDQEYNQLKSANTFPYFPEYLVDFRWINASDYGHLFSPKFF